MLGILGIQHEINKIVFFKNRRKEHMHAAVLVHQAGSGNTVQAPVDLVSDRHICLCDGNRDFKGNRFGVGRPGIIQF